MHMNEDMQRLKGDFHRWLFDWGAVTDSNAMLRELRACEDPLPRDYCTQYSLPNGSTYRDAAELFNASWRNACDGE